MTQQFGPNLFGEVPPDPHPVRRSRITNDPTARANQDTAEGRRLADLIRGFLAEMGNPTSVVLQAQAIRAAELTVAAENIRSKLLGGDTSVADAVVRLENMAARAVQKLRLEQKQAVKPKRTLADYKKVSAA